MDKKELKKDVLKWSENNILDLTIARFFLYSIPSCSLARKLKHEKPDAVKRFNYGIQNKSLLSRMQRIKRL